MHHLATAELPVGRLRMYPGNARRADVSAIAASLKANGQYRAIVVCADDRDAPLEGGVILAGNHTFLAATQQMAMETIRCELIDCDDAEARRIVLVDNKLSDKASYDEDALVELLQHAADAGGLVGTGWSEAELEKLAGEQMPPAGDAESEELMSLYGVSVECDTEREQAVLLERLSGEGLRVRALMR